MKTKVFAVAAEHEGVDENGLKTYTLVELFDFKEDASAAAFPPHVVVAVELDTREVMRALHLKLTLQERYAINCYNEIGVHAMLVKGTDQ